MSQAKNDIGIPEDSDDDDSDEETLDDEELVEVHSDHRGAEYIRERGDAHEEGGEEENESDDLHDSEGDDT